ncbi:MAG: signal recognition particle-docking protein FtsY [Pseudomonadota bacterium]
MIGSWFGRLKAGLGRSSTRLIDGIGRAMGRGRLDEAALGELEETLIAADLGPSVVARLVGRLKERASAIAGDGGAAIRTALAEEIVAILGPIARPLIPDPANRPHVVLVIGVNGSGKTTTIGKLAKRLVDDGRRVVLAAGDTFRAAAISQLKIWGERIGARVIAGPAGADPAALAYDALEEARAAGAEILFIDTAGRLHNKADLMAELGKIVRVIRKLDASAPHDVLLVLDATTGQNALAQVETFKGMVEVTGLVVTKLDGSACGGVVVAIAEKFPLPVVAIGVGEGADDLSTFAPEEFARGLLALDARTETASP